MPTDFDRVIERHLPVPLTEAERLARADEVARIHDARAAHEYDLEQAKAKAKLQLAKLEADEAQLIEEIRTREQVRPVECRLIPDFERGVVRTIRCDTGEQIDSRQMTDDERQQDLPAIAKGRRGKGKADPAPLQDVG